MSFLDKVKIINNENTIKATPSQAIDIYNNQSTLNKPVSFYMENPNEFTIENKQNQSNRLMRDIDNFLGVGKAASYPDLHKICVEHQENLKLQEEALVQRQQKEKQKEYEESWWGNKLYQQTKKSLLSMEISELEAQLHKSSTGEKPLTVLEFNNINHELENKRKELASMPVETSSFLQTGGSIVASGIEFAPQMILGAGVTLASGGLGAPAFVASALGGSASAIGIYNKSKDIMFTEAAAIVDELNPNLDAQTRAETIDVLTTGGALIESFGFSLGLGGLSKAATVRLMKPIINKYGTKVTSELIKKPSFKVAVTKTLGELAVSSASEIGEEISQMSLLENVKPIIEQGEELNTAQALLESYSGLLESFKRISEGNATDFDKSLITTIQDVGLWSLIFGSAIKGGEASIQKIQEISNNKSKAQANLKKTQDFKKARDNNKLKAESPEADKAILKSIIEANKLDGHIYIANSVIEDLINESPNSEVFANAVNKLNLVEALKNSVDGTVAIEFDKAVDVIFDGDGTLYQELENHIMWSPDSMSPAMFEIYTDALASEVTEADQKFIDDIAAKLEPTSTPNKARGDALLAYYIADALSRADPRKTREQYGRELVDSVSVGDINSVDELFVKEIEKPQTPIQKVVRKAKKAVGKVKDKLVKTDIEETIETLSASDIEEIKGANLEEVKEIEDSDFVRVGGKKMPIEYEVVELDSVQTSNDELGKINENYPQFLQNRDRSRKELLKQINTIAENIEPERLGKNVVATEGAPIVTQDGNVAVGNGRVLALKMAYNSNKAQGYKDYLTSLGYNVEGFNKPVLIRKMKQSYSDATMRKFIEEANVAGTSQMSVTEEALGDSSKLSVETLSLIDNEYDLEQAANRDFVKKAFNEIVPDVEQGRYLDDDNIITSAGIKRIKNAMLARVLPDSRILSSILESEDEVIRKVSNALLESAYSIVSFEKEIQQGNIKPEYSILSDIQTAFTVYNAAKKSGKPVKTYLKNLDLFKDAVTPSQSTFIDMFLSLKNSGEIKNKIKDYISKATIEGSTTQENLFGDVKSKEELLGGRKLYQSFEETVKQQTDTDIQGEFDVQTLAIRLSKHRNPTTFAHELCHYFTRKLEIAYKDGVLQDYWLKRYRDVMKFAGAKYNKQTKEYYFSTEEDWRKGNEKIANAFTEYLLQGKAPIKQLQPFFQKLKGWFKTVYETIKNFPRVKLSKPIIRVFDSIFAKEIEVETLMRAERLGTFERPDNVTDTQWEEYLTSKETARGASTSASIKAMEELAKKRGEESYQEQKAKFFTEELRELQQNPQHIARDIVGQLKINKATIDSLTTDVKLNSKFLTENGGLDARMVMEQYGFSSITEMVDFINNTNNTQTIAEQIATEKADAWVVEQYPELLDISAENAVRNIALIKTQVYESMMLQGIPLERFNMYYDEMILSTEKIIQGMKMNEVMNMTRWQNRMLNLNEKLITAQRKGNNKEAGKLRWRSAILNYVMLRSKNITGGYKRFEKKFDRYKYTPSKNQVKRIEGKVWDMIHSVLYNFGFTQRQPLNPTNVAQRITEYINDLQSKNFNVLDLTKEQAYFLTNHNATRPQDLKVEDFYAIDGSLRMLESASKKNMKYIQDEKIIEFDEDVNDIINHYEEKGISKWNKEDWGKNMVLGHWSMKETLLSRILPERIFLKYVAPFMDGLVNAAKFIDKKGKEIMEIIKPIMQKRKQEYTINGRVFTYEELGVIMANMGNEHNIDCIAETYGVTTQEIIDIADKAPKELRDIAQALWDMFEETSKLFKETIERITGIPLKMVEAKPITFSDGQTLRGGYYPANRKANTEAKDFLDETALKSDEMFPMYSFTKQRTQLIHGDLDTTFKTLESWLYKMAMTIEVAESYNNLSKIVHSSRIVEVMGEGAKDEITNWMSQATTPEKVSKCVATFDALASVGILGWNPIKAVVQMTGIIPAMKEVGAVRCLTELVKIIANPYNILTIVKQAKGLSNYMNQRFSNPEMHLADVRRMNWLDGGKTKIGLEWVSHIGMAFVTYGDCIASVSSWRAMYNKALSEGKTEAEATSLADSVVRRVQGDTSAGSRPPLLQGDKRFFNKFASYFIGINSMIASDILAKRRVSAVAMFAMAGILAPTIEVLLSYVYEWETADEEKRKKWRRKGINSAEDYLQDKIKSQISTSVGSSIVPAYGVGFTIGQYLNIDKVYPADVIGLTNLRELATVPVDVLRQDYEKGFKKTVTGLTPIGEDEYKRILEKLSRR